MIPPADIILVALGSNLGDSADLVRAAFDRLETLSAAPVVRSSLWSSAPVDCPPGSPRFVNAAARLTARIGDTPEQFLRELQALEREFGRVSKKVHNESRPLDLDLIAWGDGVRDTPELVLPHPRAHRRRFVLEPLSEIAPDFRLPGQRQTVRELSTEVRKGESRDESLVRMEHR